MHTVEDYGHWKQPEEEIKANVNGPEELRMNYAKPDREDNHDIAFVLALIEKIKSKYNIDEETIDYYGKYKSQD